MTQPASSAAERPAARHGRTAAWLGLLIACMTGLSFASVPLYRLFCQVTGYGGYTQRAEAPPAQATEETVTVRLDTNTAPGLGWRFKADESVVSLKIGENRLAVFRAENRSGETITGTATFNVTPEIAGAYFNKIECFCFQEQTIAPGETMEFPVSFFVDPAILDDRDAKWVREITLSYTFFRTPGKSDGKAASAAPSPAETDAKIKTGG